MIISILTLSLVVSLGHEDSRIREDAESRLAKFGWNARDSLKVGIKAQDLEISHRSYGLYSMARGMILQTLEPIPEIDAAWFDVEANRYDHELSPEFKDRYTKLVPYIDRIGKDGYPYYNYVQASREWLQDELDKGTEIDTLKETLEEMRWRDSMFLRAWPEHHLTIQYKWMGVSKPKRLTESK